MAFKGMNPEEGREVAQGVTEAGQQILELISNASQTVNSVEWIGPDYEAFKQDWNGFVSGTVSELVNGLQTKSTELTQHADEQDSTSTQG